MSEEKKEKQDSTEVTDDELTDTSGGRAAELPLREDLQNTEGSISGKITYDDRVPRS